MSRFFVILCNFVLKKGKKQGPELYSPDPLDFTNVELELIC